MILIKRGCAAIFRLLAIVVTCAICTLAYGASFNCGQAKTLVEKSICANPSLSQLDDSMAVTYKNALTLGGEKVRVGQRVWLRERDKCKDENCIRDKYQERIAELRRFNAQPVTTDTPPLSSDLNVIGSGVPRFFKIMEKSGLNGVEAAVLAGYKMYDLEPSLFVLQEVVGLDLSAYIFYENYQNPITKDRSFVYDTWDQSAVIRRIDRRLLRFISSDSKRGEVMLLWLTSVKTRMHLFYLQDKK